MENSWNNQINQKYEHLLFWKSEFYGLKPEIRAIMDRSTRRSKSIKKISSYDKPNIVRLYTTI